MDPKKWSVANVISIENLNLPYAVIILNRNILLKASKFLKLWNNASLRVVVDGGANRWLKYANNNYLNETILPPNYLTGDLDSCWPSSKQKLIDMGTKVIPTIDQNHTDFTKSLLIIQPDLVSKDIKHVLTVLDHSGRIDHILSQINTLYKADRFLNGPEVYLMTKNSLSWILRPGCHRIRVPERFIQQNYWCSYAPVGHPTKVTTEGLKYDLKDTMVEFGGIVSSSNGFSSTDIKFECDQYLFWSTAINEEQEDLI